MYKMRCKGHFKWNMSKRNSTQKEKLYMQKYCMQRTSVFKPCEPFVQRWTDTLQDKLVLTLMFSWNTLSLAACCVALLCLYLMTKTNVLLVKCVSLQK